MVFKNILVDKATFLELITALPVTIEVGGISQVNVTLVPSLLRTKLECEMDGPREGGIVSKRQITQRQERGRYGYNKTGEHCLKGNSNLRYYLALCLRVHCVFLALVRQVVLKIRS